MDLELYNDTYDVFCESIEKDKARILDIGCGPGNSSMHLVTRNPSYNINAIDVSEKMIELAKKNNPNLECQVMDCRNITELQKTFDAVICGFTIPYLSEPDCAKFIFDCGNLLEANGVLYLSFVAGPYKNSGYIKGSTGDRVYFYFHELKQIKKVLAKNSFEIIGSFDKEYRRPDKTKEIHTIIIARKKTRYVINK